MSGLTEWYVDNGNRSATFYTQPGESILDEANDVLIEHGDGDEYIITIGPLAHLIPVWRQWARWEAENQ